jgi:hypothetical protein
MYVGLHPNFLLTFPLPAWIDDDDVHLFSLDIVGSNSHRSCRWTPTPVPDEQCFEAIKAGVDALPPGTKMFLNAGR